MTREELEKQVAVGKEFLIDLLRSQADITFAAIEMAFLQALEDGFSQEREACAKIAEEKLRSIMVGNYSFLVDSYVSQIAQAIRGRK